MKTASALVLLLAAAAAISMGIVSAPASAQPTRIVPAVVMRALPRAQEIVIAKTNVPPIVPAKVDDELEELKPAEPRPIEAKVAEIKPPPAPQLKPAAVEPKPAEAKPSPGVARPPAPVAAKPPPPRPPSGEAVVPATGGISGPIGQLNLRSSDTADVYVDGRKIGGSPVLGHKVKPGKHKVRFDCYDASGEARPGVSQTYEVAADGEKDVDYDCPTE